MSKKNKYYILISKILSADHERTIKAKKNILALFFIKGFSILINLALVPLTIDYVNPKQYGVWLTLSSIIAWMSFFDVGLGHGLRNKFAEAKSKGQLELARIYVSTSYVLLSGIFLSVFILFYILNSYLNWNSILNTDDVDGDNLSLLALIVFSFFCIQMVLKLINTITIADQKPSKAALFDMIGQLLALIIIFILTRTTEGSLLYLGISLGLAPVLVLLIVTPILFATKYKRFRPSIKFVKFKFVKDIFKLGTQFFLIQIAVIVIFQTNNVLIGQVGSPEDVTIFNIAYKYIGITLMIFTIIVGPYWSAFTEAYVMNDYQWMKSSIVKLRHISYGIILLIPFMVIISKFVYQFWIGDLVIVPIKVTCTVGIYIALMISISLNTQILNGIGKVRIQVLTYSIATILHIPLALFLGNKFGLIGVLSSASIFYFIILIFSIKQVNLLVETKAHGIWNK